MVENISDDKAKESKGVTPICRFKYILYTLIDFIIISHIANEFSKIHNGELCALFSVLLNALTIVPYLMAKRTKDIGRFSIKLILGLWYLSIIGIYGLPFLAGLLHFSYLKELSYNFMILAAVLQICLIVVKGKYDTFDIISIIKPICRMILFWDYVQNKGIKRLCIVLAVVTSMYSFFAFSRYGFKHLDWIDIYWEWNNIRNALIGFYIPFIVSVIIQWVYNGFKSNT